MPMTTNTIKHKCFGDTRVGKFYHFKSSIMSSLIRFLYMDKHLIKLLWCPVQQPEEQNSLFTNTRLIPRNSYSSGCVVLWQRAIVL